MKIKLIPNNEQDLSKVFIFLLPLVVLLSASINFLKDAFRSFSNVLPGNQVLNYGFLDKLSNQISFNFLFSFITKGKASHGVFTKLYFSGSLK